MKTCKDCSYYVECGITAEEKNTMTLQDTINLFTFLNQYLFKNDTKCKEAVEIAKKAIVMQIPKKVKRYGRFLYKCECGLKFGDRYAYCPACGSPLDWGEEKSVLISIQPKWCQMIALKEKTAELRTSKPNTLNAFKCYIYCTKKGVPNKWLDETKSGKVIGEFYCRKISEVNLSSSPSFNDKLMEVLGIHLSGSEAKDYLKDKPGYAWDISNLVIYDKPKELSEFSKHGFGHPVPLKRPPQSWCYVEVMK